jgi:drug/metabolite transporter (DMT)-like permease
MGWLLLAVAVQATIGSIMVPMRYLQTEVGLPGLALVALTDLMAFSMTAWRFIPRIEKRHWRSQTLWVLVLIVIVRTILFTFALRLTRVYLVQLINLISPFIVVLLNRLFMREPMPKLTLLAITLSVVGGALVIFGGLTGESRHFTLTVKDLWGILLAFLSSFGVAGYMMMVKQSKKRGLPWQVVYMAQVGTLAVSMGLLSIVSGEDWHLFRDISPAIWLIIILYAIIQEVGVKFGNIVTLRELGAPLVSSMLAIRLVAVLFIGWLVLGERLTSMLQWVGAVLVAGTVTWYLARQAQRSPETV